MSRLTCDAQCTARAVSRTGLRANRHAQSMDRALSRVATAHGYRRRRGPLALLSAQMKSRLGHSFVPRLLPALGYPLIALIALSSSAASSAEPDATQPADSPSLSMAAVPTATYGSDEGFGTGGVASFYLHEPGVLPYKAALTLNVFITSRLIQRHRIRVDVLSVAGLPLRIYGQVGYDSTITQNFCGYGNAVTCDPKVADEVARNAGQTPETDTYQAIQQRHYLMRFIRPYAEGIVRYALSAKPHRL